MVPVKFVEAKFTRTASRAVVKARKRAFLCLGYWKMMLPEQILAFLFWRRTRWLDELTKKILYLHSIIMRAEAFEGCTVEFFAMVRMGNADEELGAFLH